MKLILKVAVVTIFGLLSASSMAEEVIGIIKNTRGHVMIERNGVQMIPVRGSEIQRGDRVITGPDGVATISMQRAAPVSVGPQNDVAIDRFAADIPIVKRPAPAILQGLASFLAVNRQR